MTTQAEYERNAELAWKEMSRQAKEHAKKYQHLAIVDRDDWCTGGK